jgi:hypothetical protein
VPTAAAGAGRLGPTLRRFLQILGCSCARPAPLAPCTLFSSPAAECSCPPSGAWALTGGCEPEPWRAKKNVRAPARRRGPGPSERRGAAARAAVRGVLPPPAAVGAGLLGLVPGLPVLLRGGGAAQVVAPPLVRPGGPAPAPAGAGRGRGRGPDPAHFGTARCPFPPQGPVSAPKQGRAPDFGVALGRAVATGAGGQAGREVRASSIRPAPEESFSRAGRGQL